MNTFSLNSHRSRQAPRRIAEPTPISVGGTRCQFESAWHPVVVNREAEAEALMEWGVSQLEAVNQLLKVIAGTSTPIDAAAIAGAVGHLTSQAETVIRSALRVHRDSFLD